ncbi:MAG TPA: helix-turn-helix transcriptional regulator [Thermoanaerobaculia bacterium]|nr:helix-turn-helix transcriptional regulator [Thermoanaerobaculia bacterium]
MPRSMTISPEAVRFGEVIRRIRRARGWTIVKLAQRAGMNANYLGVLEQGGNDTSLTTIVELCDVLGADIGEVMRAVMAVRNPPPPKPE